MTEGVAPALTPEQWAHVAANGYSFSPHENRHRIAALCLHEQPFGFTRAGLEALMTVVEWAEREGIAFTDAGEQCDAAWLEVAKIAALLPPAP